MVRRNAGRSEIVVTRAGATARAIVGTAIAAWLLAASAAGAATVSEVRVGTHEDGHTRIVVELDSMAGYRLQSPTAGGSPELIVNLDAASVSRDVPSKSRVVKKVHVEPSGDAGSTVRISLATGDVAVKETLLANPPRIVFDLKARGPLPKSDVAEAEPSEPAEAAASDTEASPEKVAVAPPAPVEPPAPAKVEVPKSAPVVVAATAAEKPSTPAPTRLTMPSASAPSAPLGDDAMPPPPSAPQPDLEPTPAAAAAAEPAPKPTYIPPIDREKHVAQSAPEPPRRPRSPPKRAAKRSPRRPSNRSPGSDSLVDLAVSPIGMGDAGRSRAAAGRDRRDAPPPRRTRTRTRSTR